MFIGFNILYSIGYRNIGKKSYRCISTTESDNTEPTDVDSILPPLEGTWKEEEPSSLAYRYTATRCSNVLHTDATTAADLFCSYFTEVWLLKQIVMPRQIVPVNPKLGLGLTQR